MNMQQKTMLETLEKLQRWVSLPELHKILGPSFSERSLRRWLLAFSKMNLVMKAGEKRGTLYKIADKSIQPAAFFTPHSQQCLRAVRQPIFERQPVTYHPEWLANYEPNKTHYLTNEQRRLLQTEGEQGESPLDPAGTFARKIYNRLLIDLSYHSSRLEGNTYSLIDTEKLILEGIESEGKLNEEKIMILNHQDAIRHLVEDISKITIDVIEICTLHYLLSDGLVLPKYAGKMRDHGVRISASTYIPIENPAQPQEQLHHICEKAAAIINPFEQSFFLLTHIAYLQAFTDVNKRTARLSANIPLLQRNVVPLSFNAIDKEDYASSMIAIYELNDTGPLADLYVFSYLKTCQEYNATLGSMNFDETRIHFRIQRREMMRHIILHGLVGEKLENYIHPLISKQIPAQHQAQFEKNVREDLLTLSPAQLVGMGISRDQLTKWMALSAN